MNDSDLAAADRAYVEAMRAEVDWAPFRFDGWGHYEQARPTMPGETIEVIARWPDSGYTLQYRPLLGELTEARQYPIDPFPTVTVLGRIDEEGLARLRSHATAGDDRALADHARDMAVADWSIPTEPPVRTGSTIPDHAEIPVHYVPSGRWSTPRPLIHEAHPSIAYAVAGRWGLRLGAPVGHTPTGLLVFQAPGFSEARLTIEFPTDGAAAPLMTDGRVGIYRYEGLGCWRQTASLDAPDELQRLVQARAGAMLDQLLTLRAGSAIHRPRNPMLNG